jgi:hypothetical protein
MSEEKRAFSIFGAPSLRGSLSLKRATRAFLLGLAASPSMPLIAIAIVLSATSTKSMAFAATLAIRSTADAGPLRTAPYRHDSETEAKVVAQMIASRDYLVSYFLDQAPENIAVSTAPESARDVIVARVRLLERPSYLVGRDQSGRPAVAPKFPFRAKLKVLDVIRGNAMVGQSISVTFGSFNSSGKRHFGPFTSHQIGRDYFVVIYLGSDDEYHLAGFPIDEARYQQWESEIQGDDQSQGRPETAKK